jgi:hypothetical protein
VTVARYPTRESVLACVDSEWRTTHAVFTAWLGEDDSHLPRTRRDALRAETFYLLDELFVQRAVEKRQVDDRRAEWRRRPTLPDGPWDRGTTTVESAAQFERNRVA